MDTFGEALRQARRHAGISLDVLSVRVSYDKSYISKVENNRRHGSRDFAVRCDDALDAGAPW